MPNESTAKVINNQQSTINNYQLPAMTRPAAGHEVRGQFEQRISGGTI